MVNDVWGFKRDEIMAEVVAKYGVACCLMHNRLNRDYDNFMGDVKTDLLRSVEIALKGGVDRGSIILDPGVGFAKSLNQNLETIGKVGSLKALGFPILLATSRKSVIGKTLNVEVDQRIEGTLVTTVMAVIAGCGFVRVHDVEANRRAIEMTRAIMEQSRY